MKSVIVYYSKHHGNTMKLIEAIAKNNDVTLYNVISKDPINLDEYDCVGFASGIYHGHFAKQILEFADNNLPKKKKVFSISTCGNPGFTHLNSLRKLYKLKNAEELGWYECPGLDTYGPFRYVGGISKGHPSENDIKGAVNFYENIIMKQC